MYIFSQYDPLYSNLSVIFCFCINKFLFYQNNIDDDYNDIRRSPSGSCKLCEVTCFLSKPSAKTKSLSPPLPQSTYHEFSTQKISQYKSVTKNRLINLKENTNDVTSMKYCWNHHMDMHEVQPVLKIKILQINYRLGHLRVRFRKHYNISNDILISTTTSPIQDHIVTTHLNLTMDERSL